MCASFKPSLLTVADRVMLCAERVAGTLRQAVCASR